MKQTKIIFKLLLPTDKYPSKAIHPAVRALNDPATCLKTNYPLDCPGLFSSCLDMRRIQKLLSQRSDIIIIIPESVNIALVKKKIPLFLGANARFCSPAESISFD